MEKFEIYVFVHAKQGDLKFYLTRIFHLIEISDLK